MQQTLAHAKTLGLEIEYNKIPNNLNAILKPGKIILNQNRSDTILRYALAHECGHWNHGHDWRHPHSRPRDEKQADQYAALLLIDETEYRDAEITVGTSLGAISKELELPARVVKIWQEIRRNSILNNQKMPTIEWGYSYDQLMGLVAT